MKYSLLTPEQKNISPIYEFIDNCIEIALYTKDTVKCYQDEFLDIQYYPDTQDLTVYYHSEKDSKLIINISQDTLIIGKQDWIYCHEYLKTAKLHHKLNCHLSEKDTGKVKNHKI